MRNVLRNTVTESVCVMEQLGWRSLYPFKFPNQPPQNGETRCSRLRGRILTEPWVSPLLECQILKDFLMVISYFYHITIKYPRWIRDITYFCYLLLYLILLHFTGLTTRLSEATGRQPQPATHCLCSDSSHCLEYQPRVTDGNDQPKFSLYSHLMWGLLVLPHSSSCVERVFSQVDMIKSNYK